MVNLFIKGNQMKLEIKRIKSGFEDVPLPKYQTDGSVGMDIYAAVEKPIVIEPKHACNVQTNVAIAVPKGYECQVRGRSGLAFKNNVFAFLGTIDSDYRGEIGVLLENRGIENFIVNRGDRIAQLIIAPIEKVNLAEVEELDVTERNTNGFGSTGITSQYQKDLESVREDGYNLQYVENQTEEICLEAVRQTGWALQYVPEKFRTKKLCLEAVKEEGGALEYVPKEIKNRWFEMMENDSFGFYDAWEKENNGK